MTTKERTDDVPMSLRMRRVLDAIKRMPIEERLCLLVKAGLMTKSEAQEAASRLSSRKKVRRKRADQGKE
jgi:hypothetical protein